MNYKKIIQQKAFANVVSEFCFGQLSFVIGWQIYLHGSIDVSWVAMGWLEWWDQSAL